jgi:hypothetical protein
MKGLVNTSQTTDDQGRVVLRIQPGAYRLQNLPARGTPYLVTEDQLEVEAKPRAEPVVVTVRPAAIVEATVVDAETGAGLPDVDLWERTGDRREPVVNRWWEAATHIVWRDSPRTDARGRLRLLIEPGKHRFGAGRDRTPPGYVAVEDRGREVECRAGETVHLELAMRRRR